MRIYVAAKTHDHERAYKLMGRLRSEGHEITYDWTTDVRKVGPDHENEAAQDTEFLRKCAEKDAYGVQRAHIVVALGHPRVCGTLVEIGMALGRGKKIILIGDFPPSVFWHMEQVTVVADEEEAIKLLHASWSIED